MKHFFNAWERFKDLLLACPHHGYDTWRVISFFYDGIFSNTRQFVEMMCNNEFISKSPDDAWDYFDLLVENAQVWETSNTVEKAKLGPSSKGGLYHLKEEDDVNSRIAKLTRKVEAIEKCYMSKANVANAYRRPFSSPYSETYNSNWQNHPNFSWRNGPSIDESHGSSSHAPYVPPHKKSLEDTLQVFIQGQTQINQVVMQDIQELKNLVGQIESKLSVREKGTFPAQPQPNPKTQFVVNEVQNPHIEHVKAITTLRNGKVIEKDIPKKVLPSKENQETKDDDGPNDKENKEDEERVYKPVAPFPQALLAHKKKETNQDILNVFRQVKVNIPLLDAIQQIPSYAKYLKDLCTVKRKHHVQKKAFLTEALLDLGASVNLLPYSVYEQLGLGELKPTKVVLQLADRSIRTSIPVILGRPFLATSNALINCRSGVLEIILWNLELSNGKVQKEELSNHEIELLETSDEDGHIGVRAPNS
uniref:Retrotransposon gag domain-containing protein n=1 Tax=Fagus sylvatica TaxID=28930 RepID=A0A2N9G8I7_FAGSY